MDETCSSMIHFTFTFLISHVASSRSAVDLYAVNKSAVGVTVPMEQKTSAVKLVRTPSFGNAMVLKLKVKDPLLSKQGNYCNLVFSVRYCLNVSARCITMLCHCSFHVGTRLTLCGSSQNG